MRPGRVVALVIGCLLVVPAFAMLLGGAALGFAHTFLRGDDGYFDATLDRVESETVAVTAEDLTFTAEPGSPDWVLDVLDADVRLRVTNAASDDEVFVGIGPEVDVDAYLAGVAHDEVIDLDHGLEPVLRSRTGGDSIAAPTEQTFWVESASGSGTQEITWEATSGRWAAVVMNADGSPGIATDVNVGAKVGFVVPLALLLFVTGAFLTAVAVTLIVVGATGLRKEEQPAPGALVEPVAVAVEPASNEPSFPVSLNARLDPDLSRWQWLVKWFLAIPHFIVLAFLWIAFFVMTVVAWFSILFTGGYPRNLFDFNVGVLRWTWRVTYYASSGGLGTDRYPPFSLEPDPDYPASLEIAYPAELSRGLIFVKWWLLAIPHYVIIGLFIGTVWWATTDGDAAGAGVAGGGLIGLVVLIAALALLFTGRYPKGLFALAIGLNRWIYRVAAYAALLTDEYPPFRLDQGGVDPADEVLPVIDST